MLVIRCKSCNKLLESHPTKTRSCQCENFTSIRGTNISGNSLSLVEIVTTQKEKYTPSLSPQDLAFQEERRQRKVRRIDFEER